jgi:hypothetical protein
VPNRTSKTVATLLILFGSKLLGCREGGNVKGVPRLGTELAVQGVTPVLKQALKPVFSFPLGLYGWIAAH